MHYKKLLWDSLWLFYFCLSFLLHTSMKESWFFPPELWITGDDSNHLYSLAVPHDPSLLGRTEQVSLALVLQRRVSSGMAVILTRAVSPSRNNELFGPSLVFCKVSAWGGPAAPNRMWVWEQEPTSPPLKKPPSPQSFQLCRFYTVGFPCVIHANSP